MKLLIISHTEHYKTPDGRVMGWGPTITEINHLTAIFEEIYHCAPLHKGTPPGSSMPYESDRIKFIPLKPSGGKSIIKKLSVLKVAFHNLSIIRNTMKKADIFQFRAPTGMGVYMIPWLMFFSGKKGWFKYAGNWEHPAPPLSYRIQKYYLIKNRKFPVTINGVWPGQPLHCISFENPCLTADDVKSGEMVMQNKDYGGKLDLIFVGRLDRAKGVHKILEVLSLINSGRIGTVHLVGDGREREVFENEAKKIKYNIIFHGFLPRSDVFELYKRSHIFILPSESEGFPKVLAEAANFGCIPVVSDISCLSDYVKPDESGWLFDVKSGVLFKQKMEDLLQKDGALLKKMAENIQKQSNLFTFEYYNNRIKNDILKIE